MKKVLLLLSLIVLTCSCRTSQQIEVIHVIPRPDSIRFLNGHTQYSERITDSLFNNALPTEGYRLHVEDGHITLEAGDEAGFFYARQTLVQLAEAQNGRIPDLIIEDSPAYRWRGQHLDVSRHFFDVDFICKQLDAMARYKMNVFHWHLTDGPGWRLEIPAYPRLTELGAWRKQAVWKDWWFRGNRSYCTEDTPGAYGGYYTAEDVRKVVRYAEERHITVIPEIEFPGHSEEVMAAYPELACTGQESERKKHPGEFCAGNPETYRFIEDVLGYVLELFPSRYIHIGGDEVSTRNWENCPRCQSLMKKEGMRKEGELQGHLLRYIEKFLKDHGRILIGWDEIYKQQLDSTSVIMAWRSEDIGREAAKNGNKVVMTPSSHCYFNSYQSDPETQPEAIGGYLLLEQVYSFHPGPTQGNILGVQGCLWSEYLPNYEIAEYMLYPRLLAMAENGWTRQEDKCWKRFKEDVNREIQSLRQRGYNCFTLSPVPFLHQDMKKDTMTLALASERTPVEIRYTTDGSTPKKNSRLYQKPILVKDSIHLCAVLVQDGKVMKQTIRKNFYRHKAIGKEVTYQKRIYPDYSAGGTGALTDGRIGGKGYQDGRWQGFCPNDMVVTLDLEEEINFSTVRANFMQVVGPDIYLPVKVEVYVSKDGKDFSLLGTEFNTISQQAEGVIFKEMGWKGPEVSARYIQFRAYQNKKKGFLFTDEIIVL